jgi:GTP-binding protein HflX
LRDIDNAYFLTKGKLEQLQELVEEHEIDEVIISEPLSPQQERNLRDYLHCKVFDRNQLILELFERNAHTSEGKAQVAIAMLQHKKTRLAGKGSQYGQQTGVIGVRGGFGETAKEKERRNIEQEIFTYKKQLKEAEQTRQTQRKRRLESGEPMLALVGYTNAGKSTIINALTKSEVLAEDKLFATLDTTTRQLFINGKKRGLISDTVGFIQALPPKLIEAFKSTLAELQFADLLLHVIDISDPNWEEHLKVVMTILEDLELDKPMVYIFNKADKVELTPRLSDQIDTYQPNVITSAHSKEGLKPLIEFLDWWLSQ